jgi:acyl-CoA synthetase (AMP-forming)/AMP-acid ligase II
VTDALFSTAALGASPEVDHVLTVVGDRTVGGILLAGAAQHPDRALLVYDPLGGDDVETYSWEHVARCAAALARRLGDVGVARGDAVHLHLPNRPEFLFAWFAAALIGARIVPTNTAAVPAELAFILGHSRAAASITDGKWRLS